MDGAEHDDGRAESRQSARFARLPLQNCGAPSFRRDRSTIDTDKDAAFEPVLGLTVIRHLI